MLDLLNPDFVELVDWCTSQLGSVELMADHSKVHGDHESNTIRLRTPMGFCYLKIHHTRAHWQNEVHAYENWAVAFGDFSPRLIAVHDDMPLALIMTEIPGQIVENRTLNAEQETAVWQAAGAALAPLHQLKSGDRFGLCSRDGSYIETHPRDAREHVSQRFQQQIDEAVSEQLINADELATLNAAFTLIPAFTGERPTPCHRDYCTANWLVNSEGIWTGVIDFEFAYWDVRVADFSRDPHWNWIHRPDLIAAFWEGYGRFPTTNETQQLIIAHAEYALGAILWGHKHAFYGFEEEGRAALVHLQTLLC
ncbi:MAG: aminoglycoside phosphotransferase family protein [Chloroflexi bacterium]|nr:aminoglycoside phosphotransferase family protein [Chloroflexota bacterium]